MEPVFFFFYKFYNCTFQTTEPDFFYSGIGTIFFGGGDFIPGRGIIFKQIPARLPAYLMVAPLVDVACVPSSAGPVSLVSQYALRRSASNSANLFTRLFGGNVANAKIGKYNL